MLRRCKSLNHRSHYCRIKFWNSNVVALQREIFSSAYSYDLNVEDERRVRGNKVTTDCLVSVSVVGWARNDSFCANFETDKSYIPTFDNLACSNLEFERLTSVTAAIKLLSTCCQGAGVMSFYFLSCLHYRTITFLCNIDFEWHQKVISVCFVNWL